jgi:acetolactate synthase-1/2/3 large subunit
MSSRRGADALAAALAAEGVQHVFTLSGNHIMPVFDAALDAGVELVHVRHEAAAVHMADAYARLTGKVGVAMVTGGPGHANAVGALYTAAMAESPVVLLSGHAPLAELGTAAFQEMRQAEMASVVTKASGVCTAPANAGVDFVKAARVAQSGRPGPVHLSLPTDVLEGVAADGPQPAIEGAQYPSINVQPAIDRIAAARRPLLLCGPMCMTREGRRRMAEVEQASGVPVIGMESPRGVNDPSLGAFAGVLARADFVLLVGKRLDFTLKAGKALAPDCEVMQVDTDRTEIDRTKRAMGDRFKGATPAETFDALDAFARATWKASSHEWRDEVRNQLAWRPEGWRELSTVRTLAPLQALLDAHPDSVFVSDGGEFGQWAQAVLHAPNRVINGVAGSIGAALPFAIGARFAKPEAPIIAAMGDGTFGFHPAEIDTAVRYKAPFLAVVGNDARWNAEYQIQLRDYGRDRLNGCELLPTRYDQVAIAFGGHGEHAATPGEVLPAARRALASGKPAVLNVTIEGAPVPTFKP